MNYREVLPPESPFWEKCARHVDPQSAQSIGFSYLCDPCTARLVAEAFNGRPPIYHGESVDGYCGLCNELRPVTLRLWFACPICWNVIIRYQKAVVSPQALRNYWWDNITPINPEFELTETGVVFLSPYKRGAKSKLVEAGSIQDSDFIVTERIDGVSTPCFHIELKAGPGSIATMKEFQLDVNDFNDIIGVARNTGLPVYIVHVQLTSDYLLPTRRTAYTGMWWSDVPTLMQHQKRIAARRGEDKKAVYFDTNAFRSMDSFVPEVAERRFEMMADQMRTNPPEWLA